MQNKSTTLLSGIAVLFVLAIYTLFIAIGPWRSRGYTSDYYSRLATSFQHGQLALEQKPDPALLALSNPYDHKARKEVPLVGDASLYKGKYYLYFGPFPSLALALLASLLPAKPGDQIFVYLFVIGLFLLQCLVFREIVDHFFSNTLGWFLPVGILILGLTGPYTRMLAHPFIHEAAIAGGQLLFVAGFYSAFLALRKDPIHQGMLLRAGILWAFSIATRTTQLLPVGFVAALTWLYIFHEHRGETLVQRLQRSTPALFNPLLLCGVLLAWYNWARFDSIFEFGLYYQLAAFNLQANYSILFSHLYAVQNIYNYFLNPFAISGNFPFIFPLPGSEKSVLTSLELPNLYAVEGKFAGILYSTPFLLFAAISVLTMSKLFAAELRQIVTGSKLFNRFDWTMAGLLGSFIAGSIPVLFYFYVGLRFETDFLPSLALLALIGFCLGFQLLKNAKARRLYAIWGVFLAVVSILLNTAQSYVGAIGA